MTRPGRDDIWGGRRRLGDVLRHWASARASPAQPEGRRAPHQPPPLDSPRRRDAPAPGPVRRGRRLALGSLRRGRRPGWWPGGRRDRGAATILVLAIGLVLVAAGGVGAAVGAARVGRHQAQVAADLGALAGAARAIEGQAAACAEAARFVAANAGRLSRCEVQGLEIVVEAEVDVTGLPGPARRARASARAGPVYAI